ncbi:TolB-like translocation protein [Paratissierella segnis]|jgi:TolB protein|uniref:TolB protein n=1 Tax=Paratissierella segnis TaxID=2763679 RepID=A0A926EQD3_9FIRM|nr:hypothetical protein [Paratissierella segnis]MBC8586856.1 hypothetical protein [Paratissierella segnis]
MKYNKASLILLVLCLIITLSACKPKEPITIDDRREIKKSAVKVEKIEKMDNMEISDWLNEETVVVSKENDSLDKMELLEVSDYYPRSLYLYNFNTKEYKLLREGKNMFLGGATFSEDKKYLLYSEYSLGDPAYYVMNMDTLDSFGISGDNIGGAISARWNGNQVIGGSYTDRIYEVNPTGEISIIEDIDEEGIYVAEKIKGNIYYNTLFDEKLIMYNQATKEKTDLNIESVYDLIPSTDGDRMLLLQNSDNLSNMVLCDIDGSNQKIIAAGEKIYAVSWSPDQRLIAYNLKTTIDNKDINNFYIYDMLNDEYIELEGNIQGAATTSAWSPLGDKMVYVETNGEKYDSSVVYLKFSF